MSRSPFIDGFYLHNPLWLSCDGDKKEEDFTNGGRGHPPKDLKFFLLVFPK